MHRVQTEAGSGNLLIVQGDVRDLEHKRKEAAWSENSLFI